MRPFALKVITVTIVAATGPALAHGVHHRRSEEGTAVRAAYDNGSPMAFCDVTVSAPGGGEGAFQTGTTDRNGGFAFLPDTNGTWTVTVDDGMGHKVTARVLIEAGASAPAETAVAVDPLHRAIVGVALLFGIFGLWALFAGHRKASFSGSDT